MKCMIGAAATQDLFMLIGIRVNRSVAVRGWVI